MVYDVKCIDDMKMINSQVVEKLFARRFGNYQIWTVGGSWMELFNQSDFLSKSCDFIV